jgi:hypothetical protein
MKRKGRKLLAASVGVAAVSYVFSGCGGMSSGNLIAEPFDGSIPEVATGNLMAPADTGAMDTGMDAGDDVTDGSTVDVKDAGGN